MDFSLSEEHKMVRDMAKRFADQELIPIAAEIDSTHRHNDEVLRKMAGKGFMGVAIPSEYGVANMDYVSCTLILTMKTTAVINGDSWILNGKKKFITNGNISKYAVVAAVTDKSKGYKVITRSIVDLEATEERDSPQASRGSVVEA